MRQALGTAVFAGMLGGALFGLVCTPVFYVVVRWLRALVTPRRRDAPPASAAGGWPRRAPG
jgi:hypothetical protein